ncbi:MAG: hypothetical protein CL947_02520 [Epsilonproteobacteria bacterium]|nr:hypothetical protein [Campylobacterota bacterium]
MYTFLYGIALCFCCLHIIHPAEAYLASLEQKKVKKSKSKQVVTDLTKNQSKSNVTTADIPVNQDLRYLENLSNQQQSTTQQKQNNSQQNNNALNYLKNDLESSNYQKKIKTEEQQEIQRNQAVQLQDIEFIKDYLNNPEYQAALHILHDADLDQAYQEGLNQLELYLFEYTQTILEQQHASPKKKNKQTNVSAYLQSLVESKNNVASNIDSTDNNSPETSDTNVENTAKNIKTHTTNQSTSLDSKQQASSNDATAWLASLERK